MSRFPFPPFPGLPACRCLALLLLWAAAGLLPPLEAAGLQPAGGPGVISPEVIRRRAAAPEGREVLWVFFTDKGLGGSAAELRALAALPPPVAGLRAARRRPPDARDLPVSPRYLAAVRDLGGVVRHTTRWLNGASVEAPLGAVDALAALPFVRRIEMVRRSKRPPLPEGSGAPENGIVDPGADPGPPSPDLGMLSEMTTPAGGAGAATAWPAEEALHYGASFNQNNQIGVVGLHRAGYTGAGVTICILDTGFKTTHPALAGRRVLATWDFVFQDSVVDNEPEDNVTAWNHGTSTWSNIAGFKPGALVGGAWEANILLAKTEDIRSETPVEEDNYVAALEWADSLGADLVSASLIYLTFDGEGDHTYADLDGNTTVAAIAVDIAVSRGMAVVNAMGNSGPATGTLGTPADADSVIAVGAVDSLGTVASFSSRGPTSDGQIKPEVVARGVRNYVALAPTNGYGPASGTSFSTPMTAGAAALLLEAHPDWDGFQMREALRTTASHAGSPDNNTGYGLVRLGDAAALSTLSPPRVSLPFALIAPARGETLETVVPLLRWERSLPGTPGDTVLYSVILSTSSTLAPADTFSAGADTTWSPSSCLVPGTTYYWDIVATNEAGWDRHAYLSSRFTISSTVDVAFEAPPAPRLQLGPARPNPFRPATTVFFTLPALGSDGARERYAVDVFRPDGRRVRRLAEGVWGPGARQGEVAWDGSDEAGIRLASGVYFVSLEALGNRETLKIVMAR